MIYRFKSKAGGDVIMLRPTGDRVLALIGKDAAPQGIIEAPDLAPAIAALTAAVAEDEARRAAARSRDADAEADDTPPPEAISLRQRAWPLVELMKRAAAEGEYVVWGV